MTPLLTITEHTGENLACFTIEGCGEPYELTSTLTHWLIDHPNAYVLGAHMENEFDDDGELVWSLHVQVSLG